MNNTQYNSILRQMAERHPLIAHSDAKPAFCRVVNSTQPMPYLFTQEFTELISSFDGYFMVAETFDGTYQQNGADNNYKNFNGAFLILKIIETGNNDLIESTLDATESIAEDCLSLLRGLFKNSIPAWKGYSIDFNNQSTEKIGPVGAYAFGVRVNLFFTKNYNAELAYSGLKWLASGTSGRPQDIIQLFAD